MINVMFKFNEPYEQDDPQTIREDFAELSEQFSYQEYSGDLLQKLACYLPTDTLRSFMDDLAMGRV
jgi:hypothetical protein